MSCTGVAGRQVAAELVALQERLGIDQPRLDLPQPVVAQIAVAVDGAAMHQAARFLVFFSGVGMAGFRLDWAPHNRPPRADVNSRAMAAEQ